MPSYDIPFRGAKVRRLIENFVRYVHLSDIVEESNHAQLCECPAVQTDTLTQRNGKDTDIHRVVICVLIVVLYRCHSKKKLFFLENVVDHILNHSLGFLNVHLLAALYSVNYASCIRHSIEIGLLDHL